MHPLLDMDINPGPVEEEKYLVRPLRWWRDPIVLCYGCLALSAVTIIISGIVIVIQVVQTNPYLHS